MRIIVAIANYGTKNVQFVKKLIHEYQSMPFDVDIFVLSEAPKEYGEAVHVLVGLPAKDPWTLPFAHKKLFAENINNYDVFIYSEDDTLIRKENILAFLSATEQLGQDILPGFIRYELYPNGEKNYTDVHGPFHWIPGSIGKSGGYTFAKLSNEHSACYILTQGQLRKAIASGGFNVPPHSGRYDLICSAGNDPYTQCGFTRVICISHLKDFKIHHLSNAYLNRAGLDEEGFNLQIEALQEISDNKRTNQELFVTEKPIATPAWDKNYYEPCKQEIVRMIPDNAKEILSVGCGSGLTEAHLLEKEKRVVAIPIDSVIGKIAEQRGVTVLPPEFKEAFKLLEGNKYDAILFLQILQHLSHPVEILTKAANLLAVEGVLVGSVPNLSLIRRFCGRFDFKTKKWLQLNSDFDISGLNMASVSTIKKWLDASGLNVLELHYSDYKRLSSLSWLKPYLPGCLTASNIIFLAQKK